MANFPVRRNGMSGWVEAVKIACRLFHNPRFQNALRNSIGTANAQPLIDTFEAFCIAFEAYMALDDFAFKIDYTAGEPQDVVGA